MTVGIKNYSKDLYQKIKARACKKLIFAELRGSDLTYRQLLGDIERLVTFFREHKVSSGSRVVIITRHDREAVTLFITALLEGLTPVILPEDTRSQRAEVIAKKVSAAVVFIDKDVFTKWPWLERYNSVAVQPERSGSRGMLGKLFGKGEEGLSHYPAVLSDYEATEPACSSSPDDIAYILFSSGTTGAPKGILITHANLFEHLKTLVRVYGHSEKSRIFNNLSIAHADGLVQGPLLALFTGGLLYRREPFTVQNMEMLLNSIYRHRITHFITVPTVIALMDRLTLKDDYFDDEAFKCIISVAAKLDKALWKRSEERLGVRICNMYGLTETVSGGIFSGPDAHTFKVGTVGKPVDMEIKIVDAEGRELPPCEDGELWMKGLNVTPGYFEAPAMTAELFCGPWMRTGDMARVSAEGFVEIVGRIKSIIMSGGFNIHPDEIDEVLMSHPHVRGSATVGIPDDDWGEIVVSAVESDVHIEEAELINHCRRYLESLKVPKRIIVTDKLPRGISGKIVIPKVRELLAKSRRSQVSESTGPTKRDVIALAASVFNVAHNALSLRSTSSTVAGWDSLGHLDLVTEVEQRYSIEFGMDEMMSIDSIKRLLELIQKKTERS